MPDHTPFRHGDSGTRFYRIWAGLKSRCSNANWMHKSYIGISVCDRWKSYLNFKEDMFSGYQEHVMQFGEKDTTIDRIDNKKGYEKENCRWATTKEQNRNSSNAVMVKINDETLPIRVWAKKYNINHNTIYDRLRKGWTHIQAITHPVLRYKYKNNEKDY